MLINIKYWRGKQNADGRLDWKCFIFTSSALSSISTGTVGSPTGKRSCPMDSRTYQSGNGLILTLENLIWQHWKENYSHGTIPLQSSIPVEALRGSSTMLACCSDLQMASGEAFEMRFSVDPSEERHQPGIWGTLWPLSRRTRHAMGCPKSIETVVLHITRDTGYHVN